MPGFHSPFLWAAAEPHAFGWFLYEYFLHHSAQVTIWTNSIAHSTNSTSNYRFNFLLDTPPNNLQRVFAVLAGYSLENANSIDYFVNLIFYNASLPLTLEFNCYGDMKVYSMSFAVIAIAPPSNPYLTLEEYSNPLSIQ